MPSPTLDIDAAADTTCESSDSTVQNVDLVPITDMDELQRFKLYRLFQEMPDGIDVSTGFLYERDPDTIHLANEAVCLAHLASIDGDKRKLFVCQLLRIVSS